MLVRKVLVTRPVEFALGDNRDDTRFMPAATRTAAHRVVRVNLHSTQAECAYYLGLTVDDLLVVLIGWGWSTGFAASESNRVDATRHDERATGRLVSTTAIGSTTADSLRAQGVGIVKYANSSSWQISHHMIQATSQWRGEFAR